MSKKTLSPSQVKSLANETTPKGNNHYDELTLQTSEVTCLASLIDAIGDINRTESLISPDVLFAGCGAVARVILEKITVIEKHAAAIQDGAR